MLHILLQIEFILLLYILARSADLAITSTIGRSYIRAFCYGLVAILALIVVVLTLVHY